MFAIRRYALMRCLTSVISSVGERTVMMDCGSTLFKLSPDIHVQHVQLSASLSVQRNSYRGYAKSKGRQGSSKHASGRPKVEVNDDELAEVLKVTLFRDGLSRALQNLGDSYKKQLTIGNAAANVESIAVSFEGSEVQLCEVAQIQKKPNLVVLQFTSFPEAIKPAIKAIQDSGMRATVQQESTTVFLQLPKLTRQQREDMAKSAKTLFQKCKDELSQLERRCTKEIQGHKQGQSEDLIYNAQQQVKFEIEQAAIKAETMMKTKQKELLNEG